MYDVRSVPTGVCAPKPFASYLFITTLFPPVTLYSVVSDSGCVCVAARSAGAVCCVCSVGSDRGARGSGSYGACWAWGSVCGVWR